MRAPEPVIYELGENEMKRIIEICPPNLTPQTYPSLVADWIEAQGGKVITTSSNQVTFKSAKFSRRVASVAEGVMDVMQEQDKCLLQFTFSWRPDALLSLAMVLMIAVIVAVLFQKDTTLLELIIFLPIAWLWFCFGGGFIRRVVFISFLKNHLEREGATNR